VKQLALSVFRYHQHLGQSGRQVNEGPLGLGHYNSTSEMLEDLHLLDAQIGQGVDDTEIHSEPNLGVK
jgi:hypothetical protein